jgi:hypothetical protein
MAIKKSAKKAEISEGEKSLLHNIRVITNGICDRIAGPMTPKKRKEVETVVSGAYLSRMKDRSVRGPITEQWHNRMVAGLTARLNKQFEAFAPSAFRNASKEERTRMLLTKTERAVYDRAKAADSKDPLRDAFGHSHEQWKKRRARQEATA